MIEQTLATYGVLGLWTLSLLAERITWQKEIKKILGDLTLIIKTKLK